MGLDPDLFILTSPFGAVDEGHNGAYGEPVGVEQIDPMSGPTAISLEPD
jgi:hypothetical protein